MTFDEAKAKLGNIETTLAQIMAGGVKPAGLALLPDGRGWHGGVTEGRHVGFGTGRTAAEAMLRAAENCGPDDVRAGRGTLSKAAGAPAFVCNDCGVQEPAEPHLAGCITRVDQPAGDDIFA